MSTDAQRRGVTRKHWVLLILLGLFGAGLMAVALPRIAAHAALTGTGATMMALDQGRTVLPAALIAAHAAHDEALSWLPADAGLRRDRARMARRLAGMSDELVDGSAVEGATDEYLASVSAHAGDWRRRAVEDLRQAAAAAPGDGVVWAMLADAELAAGATPEAVLPALRLARLTAPRRASALLLQHRIAMRHWGAMPDEMRAHAMSDVVQFWRRGQLRGFLVASYIEAGFAARVAFREKLDEDPRALQQFDRMLSAALGARGARLVAGRAAPARPRGR